MKFCLLKRVLCALSVKVHNTSYCACPDIVVDSMSDIYMLRAKLCLLCSTGLINCFGI